MIRLQANVADCTCRFDCNMNEGALSSFFNATFESIGDVADIGFGEIQYIKIYEDTAPIYNGPYEVNPQINKQELQTKDKLMADDISVLAIPYYETQNSAGGNTVIIGGD